MKYFKIKICCFCELKKLKNRTIVYLVYFSVAYLESFNSSGINLQFHWWFSKISAVVVIFQNRRNIS